MKLWIGCILIFVGMLSVGIALGLYPNQLPTEDPLLPEITTINQNILTLKRDIAHLQRLQLNTIDILTEVRDISPDTLWLPVYHEEPKLWTKKNAPYFGVTTP